MSKRIQLQNRKIWDTSSGTTIEEACSNIFYKIKKYEEVYIAISKMNHYEN